MSDNYTQDFRQMRLSSGRMLREIPDVLVGYGQLSKGAMKDGAVSAKNKELIALGIAVATPCDGCIMSHVQGAINKGATRAEMHEVISVAILMSGGPATVDGAEAYEVIDEFLNN